MYTHIYINISLSIYIIIYIHTCMYACFAVDPVGVGVGVCRDSRAVVGVGLLELRLRRAAGLFAPHHGPALDQRVQPK